MAGSILVSRSLAETRSAPAAMISRVFFAQVCGQRCTQPGQTRREGKTLRPRRAVCGRGNSRQDLLGDLGYQAV